MKAQVVGIYITSAGGAPLRSVQRITAHAEQGLEGDRYFMQQGTFSKPPRGKSDPGTQATFIESEAIEALEREYGIRLEPAQSRRNIITRGIALNHLVGCEFQVGPVRFRGIKFCEPCGHLEKLTTAGVRKGLVHRGGLRAQILTSGEIVMGDPIITNCERTMAMREPIMAT